MTGEALRRWRISIGASQAEIAKRAGVSRQTIVAYEQKDELPMTKILEAYGLVIQPIVCSISENLDNFTDRLKEEIEEKTGRKCQIKINIELCEEEEEMTKHQWVEQAKEEARLNLTGEDLEKCFKALEAWERNTQTE